MVPTASFLKSNIVVGEKLVKKRVERHPVGPVHHEPHPVAEGGAAGVVHEVVRVGFGPGAILGGGSHLGDGAFAGMGCLIRDHVTIGQDAIIGMGAVVIDDVRAGVTVIGVPARPVSAG